MNVDDNVLAALAERAWQVRSHAYLIGKTAVGCAVLGQDGHIYVGCNVEHIFRSHDVHAEVNAITSMIASGCTRFVAAVVAAERDRFTPCGACMDWIMQHGGPDCIVAFAGKGRAIEQFTAHDLMPHYPS